MNVLLLALTLAATVVAADRREIVGTLTIGADTYTVAGTIAEDGAKETKLSLILSHGGKTEHRIEVVLGGVSSAILDGVAVPIPSALAAEWRDQLKASKTPDTSQFVCTRDRNELNCDTRTVSEFAQGLFGRLRMSYNNGRVVRLRFFSLAEFNNPVFQNISLALDFK
jgi:hypothetical protein